MLQHRWRGCAHLAQAHAGDNGARGGQVAGGGGDVDGLIVDVGLEELRGHALRGIDSRQFVQVR